MDDVLAAYFDEEAFRRRFLRTDRYRFVTKPSRRKRVLSSTWNQLPELKHISPRWIRRNQQTMLGGDVLGRYLQACFVRHPLDRLLSVYSFHTQRIPHVYPDAVRAGSFENWLMIGGTGSARKSMKAFLTVGDGRLLVDFVGRYEELKRDWSTFLSLAGLPPIDLMHNSRTRTTHEDWRSVYTGDLLDIVRGNRTWREDLEFFDYAV